MAVLTADHFIAKPEAFRQALSAAAEVAARTSWSRWESGPTAPPPVLATSNKARAWKRIAARPFYGLPGGAFY